MQNEAPIIEHLKGSKKLIVSFGGVKLGVGMPVFEFMKVLDAVDCDQLFIRDFNQSWYHQGISPQISDIELLNELIRTKIEGYDEVCFIGNSMGGYAAILFGTLLNVGKVIAFSPQSFIGKFLRFRYNDKRWNNEISTMYAYEYRKVAHYDLKKTLRNNQPYKTIIEVHYSFLDTLDKIHSERLTKASNVRLIGYDFSGHRLVKELKNRGELEEIISQTFSQ